jgi:arginyl-tRNA synthetase
LGEDIGAIPEGLYPGDYLVPVGKAIAAQDGDKWRAADESAWLPHFRKTAIAAMMDLIRGDLKAMGVNHAVFSSEKALVDAGGVAAAQAFLESKGLIYQGVL